MKIYALLGLLLSVFSVGSTAEGQVVVGSSIQGCQNCSHAVNFTSQSLPSQPAFTDGTMVVDQPIYQDTSVVSGTYISPTTYATAYSTASVATPYSVSSVRQPISRASTSSFAANVRSGLAQTKAVTAARMGLRGHLGGGLGNAKYEGVGWSTQSAQSAIEHCCYWGTRPVSQIGVAKGNDGCWYACVLYQ